MPDLEPPPLYVEYPRSHLTTLQQGSNDNDFNRAWALILGGIFLSPLIGVWGLYYINRAVRKGYRGARLHRAIQIAVLLASTIWWILEAFDLWDWARHLFGA